MPGLQSECEIERSKAVARWFGIAAVAGLLVWQRARGVYQLPDWVLWAICGGGSLCNLLHSVYLFNVESCPRFYKYLTVGLDSVFITAAIAYTGFNQSPFFFLYFVLLIANCIRYGLLMSIYIAGLVNVLYVLVLSLAPALPQVVLGGEGLKILAFWGVALYGGGVAARVRRQAWEIAAMEETIAELQEEVRRLRGAGDA